MLHLQVVLLFRRAPRVSRGDVSQEQVRLDLSALLSHFLRRGNVQAAPREAAQGKEGDDPSAAEYE